jgi:hypothetical protein
MEQTNPSKPATKIKEIVAGINLVECDYRVKVPVFEDEVVKRAVFVDEQVKVPVGFDKIVNALALDISEKIIQNVIAKLDERLEKAIESRLTEIKYPKLVEELKVTQVPVNVDKPVYVDVEVKRPVFVDHEVINPVKKDVEVVNAIIIDKPVMNCIVEDIRVTNAIIKDVEVERAVIREKVVEVIHKQCLDAKGNPL